MAKGREEISTDLEPIDLQKKSLYICLKLRAFKVYPIKVYLHVWFQGAFSYSAIPFERTKKYCLCSKPADIMRNGI